MHEMARHAIHSSETLSMSVETVEVMQQQIIDLSTTQNQGGSGRAEASRHIRTHVEAQIRMLRSLLLRSQSNKERLQNEIALVRAHSLDIHGASADIMAGVQFDRPARQPSDEGSGAGGETG
jgi:hypothetical protein